MTAKTIDADGHVFELHSRSFLEYVEEPFRTHAIERAERLGAHPQLITVSDGWDRQVGGRFWYTASTEADDWIRLLDDSGIDQAVLFPTFGLLLGVMPDPEFASAYARAYNRWIHEEIVRPGRGRLHAVGCLAPQDPVSCAEELKTIDELSLAGALMPADGVHLLGSSAYHRVYEIAASLRIPIVVHAAGTHLGGRHFPKFIQVHSFNHPASVLAQFTSLMLEGVPSLFPTLKLGFFEIGVTWVPWYAHRLDEEYEKRGEYEAKILQTPLSRLVFSTGQLFFTAEVSEPLLPYTLQLFEGARVMYGSDWPHWDHEFPKTLHALRSRSDLTEAQILSLTSTAAQEFFRMA